MSVVSADAVSVIIPWHEPEGWEGKHRARLWRYVSSVWNSLPFEVVVADSPRRKFSVASALNSAARRAHGQILITYGADQIPNETAVRNAAQRVHDGAAWSPVFNRVGYIRQELTDAMLTSKLGLFDLRESSSFHHVEPGAPGLFATSMDVWKDLGGMDEKFTGWGYEDLAMLDALGTLHPADPTYPRYLLCELWHPSPHRVRNDRNPSYRRYHEMYVPAKDDPEKMRALISG